MSFSESLTVRILADTSHFQRELDGIARRIADFRTQLAQLSAANQQLDRAVGRIATLVQPLTVVSALFQRIAQQALLLSQTPISLNVQPAINSLVLLGHVIDIIALKLANLIALSHLGGMAAAPANPRLPRFAHGGLVDGPPGLDRVPALLSAGEFIIRRPAADRLGLDFLNSLNQLIPAASSRPISPQFSAPAPTKAHGPRPVGTTPPKHSQPAAAPQTVNNFGGITLHVARPVDINHVIRDLRFQGFHLRNRRG